MIHYLQCNNCGNRNEMKSEYVVFCTSCGQKLDNNFTQWQRRNPGGTFEDFKRNACFTEDQLPPAIPIKKGKILKSRSLKEKILIVVITTIFAAVGSWLGSAAVTALKNNKKTDEKVLSEQWVKKTYGTYQLTLETPWELKSSTPPPLPENIKRMLEKMETFETSNNDQFKVGVILAKYNPAEIGELNMQGAADGAVNEVKGMQGVTNFVYSEDSYSVSNLPGFIQRGTYTQNGYHIAFINIGIVKDLNYWQVMVLSRRDDKVAEQAAERIIQSIQINYPS